MNLKFIYPLVTAVFMFVLVGCKTETASNLSFFGGTIQHPVDDKVLIMKNGNILDSIFLDRNNAFKVNIPINQGELYIFKHGIEHQQVFLEPGDSISIFVNTKDFDESLTFHGKGSKKNNFLIRSFLKNEKDELKSYKDCRLTAEAYQNLIKERHKLRLDELNHFASNKSSSIAFYDLAKADIDFNSYRSYEVYPFAHFGYAEMGNYKELPKDFYAYRKTILFNDPKLNDHIGYNRFLFFYFNNLALDAYYKDGIQKKFDKNCIDYNKRKLDLIDEVIEKESIKNHNLKYATREFIYTSNNYENNKSLLNHFKEKCSDVDYVKDLSSLVERLENLKPGNKLPLISFTDYKNNTVDFEELINRPSFIYFWSYHHIEHFIEIHNKVNLLSKQYPNIDFIGININNGSLLSSRQQLEAYQFPIDKEFKFKSFKEGVKTYGLSFYSVSRGILLNADLEIVDSKISLFSKRIDALLNQF